MKNVNVYAVVTPVTTTSGLFLTRAHNENNAETVVTLVTSNEIDPEVMLKSSPDWIASAYADVQADRYGFAEERVRDIHVPLSAGATYPWRVGGGSPRWGQNRHMRRIRGTSQAHSVDKRCAARPTDCLASNSREMQWTP